MSTTDFGFEKIPEEEKVKRVGKVFSSVAKRYDVMNDLMSLGIHRVWKQTAIDSCNIKLHSKVLDLAGGTGDLAKLIAKRLNQTGCIYVADINADMLNVGRERLLDQGFFGNLEFVQCNAENLPFEDNYFDCITIAFGLRNVTDKAKALRSMYSVLKPGGTLMVLEFSKPTNPIFQKIYDQYSFTLLPALGKLVADDADSYKYLVESIRMHPDQNTLKQLIEEQGFEDCSYQNLTGGIVAIHRAFKY